MSGELGHMHLIQKGLPDRSNNRVQSACMDGVISNSYIYIIPLTFSILYNMHFK